MTLPAVSRLLFIGNFAQAFGLQLFSPILPLYLSAANFSNSKIGVVVSAGILGYGLGQFPAGRLSDRVEKRLLIVLSMFLYGALFLVYLMPMSFVVITVFRFLHASLAAIFSVSSLALLTELISAGTAGRVFSQWQALGQLGFVLGPMAGGLIGAIDLEWDFVFCGIGYLLLGSSMLFLPRSDAVKATRLSRDFDVARNNNLRKRGTIVSLLFKTGAGDFTAGLVTSVGGIWIISLGGSPVAVGVFFACLALPTVLFSRIFGKLLDGSSGEYLIMVCLIMLIISGVGSGLVSSPSFAMFAAVGLGVGLAPLRPFAFSSLAKSDGASTAIGRRQGELQGGLMLVQFSAAAVGGFMLERSHLLTFGGVSAVACLSLLIMVYHRLQFR